MIRPVLREGGWATFRPSGDIDAANASQIVDAVTEVATDDRGMLLDLDDVTYIDSAGIRAILAARHDLAERRQEIRLIMPDDSVLRRALEVAGLLRIVSVFGSLEDARGA